MLPNVASTNYSNRHKSLSFSTPTMCGISRPQSQHKACPTTWPAAAAVAAAAREGQDTANNTLSVEDLTFADRDEATVALTTHDDNGTRTARTKSRVCDASIQSAASHCDGRRGPHQLRRRGRRRRQRTETENDLFTSFTLNRDPENSKYLPYDEVVYPKLFNRPREARLPRAAAQAVEGLREGSGGAAVERAPAAGGGGSLPLAAAAELDGMWLVGFVENARRNQKDLLLKELRDFVRLPGSTVLPGAHAALATISHIEVSTSFNSSTNTHRNRMGSQDGDDGAGRARSAAGDAYGARGRTRADSDDNDPSSSGGTSALTALERLRLRELERRLSQASLGVRDEDVRRHAGVAAYSAANRKLRKILRGARPPVIGPSVKSQSLEAVFQRNRAELAAAVRIQRIYKHHYRKKRFNALIRQLKGVVNIQALARGVIARRFVAEWYLRRSSMVLAWQTIIRRMLSNIHWKRQLEIEYRAASRLQAGARGRAAREKALNRRASLAVLRIQCLWRGCVDRARIDRIWLGAQATRIQGLARVMVAKRVVGRKRRICNAAARSIQRCFRGTVARSAMKRLIWERAVTRRVDFLRLLAAEEEWERENMELTQRRSSRMRLEERLKEALEAETAAHTSVFELETNEQELNTQRQMLSPRALQQGWKEELDSNIGQHRHWIMKRKLEAVFDAGLPARELEEEVERRDHLLKERQQQVARLARWREAEMRGIFDREARRRFDDQHLQHLRKVADEKRKWAVKHVNESGKPDKLKARRRSRPWEAAQDPAERVLKQVFTGGGVDLFAYDRTPEEAVKVSAAAEDAAMAAVGGIAPTQTGHARGELEGRGVKGKTRAGPARGHSGPDSAFSKRGELPQIMARLQLQSHVNQVAQFNKILRPAEEIIQRIGLAPTLANSAAKAAAASVAAAAPLPGTESTPPPPSPPTAQDAGETAQDHIVEREEEDDEEEVAKGDGQDDDEDEIGHLEPVSFRPAAAGFSNRYGAAASTPPGRPPPAGTGGTPVPSEWGEEERVRARRRQRRLHMLSQPDDYRASTAGTHASRTPPPTKDSSSNRSGDRDGVAEGARSMGRVPWHLLDELDAEKTKLRVLREHTNYWMIIDSVLQLCKIWR